MPQLIPLYAQIDDATLEAMASKGIVRRARADAVNVHFESTGADEIVGTIEGATVRLDDKGLAKARCSCPAATVCRHRIAVVLALRTQAGEQQAAPTVEIDWPTRLSTFDRKTLQSAVGKTGLREAIRLMALAEATTVEAGQLSLKVVLRLNAEEIEVAIPAQGDFATQLSAGLTVSSTDEDRGVTGVVGDRVAQIGAVRFFAGDRPERRPTAVD